MTGWRFFRTRNIKNYRIIGNQNKDLSFRKNKCEAVCSDILDKALDDTEENTNAIHSLKLCYRFFRMNRLCLIDCHWSHNMRYLAVQIHNSMFDEQFPDKEDIPHNDMDSCIDDDHKGVIWSKEDRMCFQEVVSVSYYNELCILVYRMDIESIPSEDKEGICPYDSVHYTNDHKGVFFHIHYHMCEVRAKDWIRDFVPFRKSKNMCWALYRKDVDTACYIHQVIHNANTNSSGEAPMKLIVYSWLLR